jgi:hypothetical protein
LLDHFGRGVCLGNVTLHCQSFDAKPFKLARQGIRGFDALGVVEGDICTSSSQLERDGTANPARSSGNDGRFAGKEF